MSRLTSSLQVKTIMKKIVKEHGLFFVLLVILVSIAYHNSLFGEFISDDMSLVTDVKHLGDFKYLITHNFFLVLALVRYSIYHIGGLNPFYFHLVNLSIHLINVYLVYFLIFVVSNKQKQIAFFTAGLFAVHPVLTESVTWISGMGYLLNTLFILGSFLFFIAYLHHRTSLRYYIWSLLLFLCALLSSVQAAVFPFILIAYYFAYVPKKKNWFLMIPYGILAFFLVLLLVLPNVGSRIEAARIGQGAGAVNILFPLVSLTTYIRLFIWPDKLTLLHVDPVSPTMYVFSFIVFIVIVTISLYFWRRKKQLFFWLMFFILSALLVLTPFPVASFVGERYVYLGSIGLFYLFGTALILLSKQLRAPALAWVIYIVCIILLIARTIERNNDWRTKQSFWSSTAAVSPFSYQAHNNYGLILLYEGKKRDAAAEFNKTVILKPDYAEGHQNLAYTYQLMARLPEALEEYKMALNLYEKTTGPKPILGKAYQNIGGLYLIFGQYDEALIFARKAFTLDPLNADLLTNIGIIYLKKGEKEKAKNSFVQALQLNPNFTKAQFWLRQF